MFREKSIFLILLWHLEDFGAKTIAIIIDCNVILKKIKHQYYADREWGLINEKFSWKMFCTKTPWMELFSKLIIFSETLFCWINACKRINRSYIE